MPQPPPCTRRVSHTPSLVPTDGASCKTSTSNIQLSNFMKALDEGLFELRGRVIQEYAQQLQSIPVWHSDQPNECSSLFASEGFHNGDGDDAQSNSMNKHAVEFASEGLLTSFASESHYLVEQAQRSLASPSPRTHDGTYNLWTSSRTGTAEPDVCIDRWRDIVQKMLRPKGRQSSGPSTYYLHDCWVSYLAMLRNNEGNSQSEYAATMAQVMSRRHESKLRQSKSFDSVSVRLLDVVAIRRYMLHPHSPKRMAWVFLTVIFLIYDAVMLPISAFFDIGDSNVFIILQWSGSVFWFLDIAASFTTGVYVNGAVEMRPRQVAQIYIRTWLPFDVLLVFTDWVLAALDVLTGDRPLGQYGTALRSVRIIRLARLLRLGKLEPLLREALAINIRSVIVCSGAIKSSLVYVVYLHVLACVWYGIGGNDGWGQECDSSSSVSHCYFRAAHWAVTQLHGTSLVTYNTTLEWAFATVSLYVGMFLFACLLGRIGDAVSQLVGADKVELRQRCATYTKKHFLTSDLAHRLLRYIDSCDLQVEIGQQLQNERELLRAFPLHLQSEILEESRKPLLSRVVIVCHLEFVSRAIVKKLCTDAISSSGTLNGEPVFQSGDSASYWRIIEDGNLVYVTGHQRYSELGASVVSQISDTARHQNGDHKTFYLVSQSTSITSNLGDQDAWQNVVGHIKSSCARTLARGDVISEMVLWTFWVHTGNLIATNDSILLQITLKDFASVVQSRTDTSLLVARYAQTYVRQMSARADSVSDLFEYDAQDAELEDTAATNHVIFLSHYKAEAGTEATLMQEALELLISRDGAETGDSSVFLDSEDLRDLTTLRDHVINSRNLVLLLTPGVLSRPWCLIEIITAMNHGVQIVPVEIQRPGLEFKFPNEDFYTKLRAGKQLSPGNLQMLRGEGITPRIIEESLRFVFMQIALPFSPHKSKNIREAELVDIVRRCMPDKNFTKVKFRPSYSMSSTSMNDSARVSTSSSINNFIADQQDPEQAQECTPIEEE